jgi:hypothetical protein
VSGLVWQERQGIYGLRREAGHNQMVIDSKPGYQDRLGDCAEEAAHRFLRRLGWASATSICSYPLPRPPASWTP